MIKLSLFLVTSILSSLAFGLYNPAPTGDAQSLDLKKNGLPSFEEAEANLLPGAFEITTKTEFIKAGVSNDSFPIRSADDFLHFPSDVRRFSPGSRNTKLAEKNIVKCETSNGSPNNQDVLKAMARLQLSWDIEQSYCCQDNLFGSKCTRLQTFGTASIGICGTWDKCLKCEIVVAAAIQVYKQCLAGDKVGGTYVFKNFPFDSKIIVYHR